LDFPDRLEIEKLALIIPYSSITNIENADEKKISALRVVALGLVFLPLAIVGAVWKKKHIYTILEYTDRLNETQTLIFDFKDDIEKAQGMIYKKMIEYRTQKELPPTPTLDRVDIGHNDTSTGFEATQKDRLILCKGCGNTNPIDSSFCNKCGCQIQNVCHNCGNINTNESLFCNKCGSSCKTSSLQSNEKENEIDR
jgi:ribosomal protein L40E